MAITKKIFHEAITKVKAQSRAMAHYFTAQSVTIAANLLYGLLCVRLLPSADYAKFVVLFGVQGTVLVLMDVNFSGTLIPLIGERINNHKLIADYIASLRQLSYWSFAVVGAGTIVCYPILVKHRSWDWLTVTWMILILLLSTWFARIGSAYGAVLILLRQRPLWYRTQMIYSLGTLALLGAFWMLHWLSAFTAISINVMGIVYIGVDYYVQARRLLGVGGSSRPELRHAIIRLALPNIPQAIFFALQGQISLFLITFFGHTQGVAGVGALGRLGQIFIIFKQGNTLFVEPYFAKIPKNKVRSSYVITVGIVGSIGCVFMLAAHWEPQLLLWLLGPQYSGFRSEVQIAIGASAISYLSSALWAIHSARRFVYWWNVGLSIFLTLAIQVLFIAKVDMGVVRGVLLLTLATNTVSLFTNVLSGVYGFVKGPRETETKREVFSEQTVEADQTIDVQP